ncbi:MAG TPA: 1-(5-phosphoribosyl)-5-[(5-phosphoribosylamino)methylideneamino] imidazole-4-carboxamide isomerase [Gemmatimonadaceae bacterium]|nr:1-(5-phosphoribosyl)-5-[(5-phosphoribosylamino)methylideneamino] imidazole-4-carboxamide isomerase [Gemmatimonadaceae bacterium]
MIAIPAVDLRGGACVQLVGGDPAQERVRISDPVSVVRRFERAGFHRLHLVDLDAATDTGSNRREVEEILRDTSAAVQVGGGVRSTDTIEQLLDAGAEHVIVGTRALEEPDWLAHVASLYPGALIVATDVRERRLVTRGWVRTLPLDAVDVVQELNAHALGGILVTAVHLEGRMRGPDLTLMEDVAEASHWPIIASGGIASIEDIRALEHRGITAVVLGMSLYTGTLDPLRVAQEFGG